MAICFLLCIGFFASALLLRASFVVRGPYPRLLGRAGVVAGRQLHMIVGGGGNSGGGGAAAATPRNAVIIIDANKNFLIDAHVRRRYFQIAIAVRSCAILSQKQWIDVLFQLP